MAKVYTKEELNSFSRETLMAVIESVEISESFAPQFGHCKFIS